MGQGAQGFFLRFAERLSFKRFGLKVVLWSRDLGLAVPPSPDPVLPRSRGLLVLRSPGPLWFLGPVLFRSRGFPTFCCVFYVALWFLWPPGLRVRWSPGHPIRVPLVFWFSSPGVLWSLDALVFGSSTCFLSQFLGLLVLWSSRSLVLWL